MQTKTSMCTNANGKVLLGGTRHSALPRCRRHSPPATARKPSSLPSIQAGSLPSPPAADPHGTQLRPPPGGGNRSSKTEAFPSLLPQNPVAVSSKATTGSSVLGSGTQTAARTCHMCVARKQTTLPSPKQAERPRPAARLTCSTLSMSSQSWSSRSAAISSR